VNEPDRRHPFDGFDADAMFADIVAHMNDEAVEPERVETPWADDATADDATADDATADDATADDATADDATADDTATHETATHDSATEQPSGEDWPPVNHPQALPPPGHPEAVPTPQVWRAFEVDDEYEEHFEPPPVAPLPVGDLQFWGIIVGMGGGPLLLLYLMFFNRGAGTPWILTSIALSVGGFALLVARLPSQQEGDDDGARL
jgi:hypothetical protein